MTVLHYDDETPKSQGEGITRTCNPRAELWPLMVYMPGVAPMKTLIRAMNAKEAKAFAKARHPTASKVELISKRKRKKSP